MQFLYLHRFAYISCASKISYKYLHLDTVFKFFLVQTSFFSPKDMVSFVPTKVFLTKRHGQFCTNQGFSHQKTWSILYQPRFSHQKTWSILYQPRLFGLNLIVALIRLPFPLNGLSIDFGMGSKERTTPELFP